MVDSRLGHVEVACDATVVFHVNASMSICANVGLIIRDIKEFLHTDFCLSVSHDPRQGNRMFHKLAKYALTLGENLLWMEGYPHCVGNVVLADIHVSL